MEVDLSLFDVGTYKAGPKIKVLLWFFVNYYIFDTAFPWPYALKRHLLIMFGANIGKGVVIKPKIRIKNPWRLSVGNHCWLGESIWIDNLQDVVIGNNVIISQGVMLLTGNHDYTVRSLPYRLDKIVVEDGAWIGAQSVVCPGVVCESHSILTVGSVATKRLDSWSIYSGNPAVFIRNRKLVS